MEARLQSKLRSAGQWLRGLLRSKALILMVGGALGTALRYGVGSWFNAQPWGQSFPYGTLFINVTGSFILGAAAVIILERLPPEHQDWYLLVGTGFCGGYTTFSSFEWETYKLAVRGGCWELALANVLGSVAAGFLGVFLAVYLASGFSPRT
jgi:CrcB protein